MIGRLHVDFAHLPVILALGLASCGGPPQHTPTPSLVQPPGIVSPPTPQQQLEDRAAGGDTHACFRLGQQYDKREEFTKAFSWYQKAANGGLAQAHFNLGLMYEDSQGVAAWPEPKPTSKGQIFGRAAFHYRQASTKGNLPQAEYNLGLLHAEGKPGLLKNSEIAFEHYRKAADQDFTLAQRAVARAFANGEGSDQDFIQSVKWYRRAAELNDPAAQFELGLCYATSRGVKKDLVEAYKWINIATANGHAQASKARERLEQSIMTDMQIKEAQKRSKDWNDAHQKPPAPRD